MGVFDKYSCEGQMSIFDFMQDKPNKTDTYEFSWDDDINEIYHRLVNLVSKHRLSVGNTDWEIWGHVPQFGYRMSFTIKIKQELYTQAFLDDLQEIVEFAKSRKVELSPMNPMFIGSDEGCMHIFSTFMDKERQKIK